MLRILVESAATAEPVIIRDEYDGELPLLVSDPNATCSGPRAGPPARCRGLGRPGAARHRRPFDVRIQPRRRGYAASAKVPNACILGLGLIGSEAAIACLLDLQRTVKHAGFGKQIGAALAAAAERAGLTLGELAERLVPDAGLDVRGERQIAGGGTVVWVSIGAGWRVKTEWQTPAGRSARAPADADADAARQAACRQGGQGGPGRGAEPAGRAAGRRAVLGRRGLATVVSRPSRHGSADQGPDLVVQHRVDRHPRGRRPARRPRRPAPDPARGTVRLWHPARADTAQVRQWRDYLVSAERTQPFKQAFREVYLIIPAELETRLYSNRFAAHVLRYQQAYALFRERGWTANYLGPYDGGYEGQARRDFPGAGLTAYFDHYQVNAGPFAYPVDLCSTDRVSFCRTGDRHCAPVPLDEVPELVFSDAMRDLDLFVSVTSIAPDPQWADRGEDPHFAYWREYSFGDLTETAVVRSEALARLVPKLKIAPRLELTGRYLRVQGQLNSYKIHIGSATSSSSPMTGTCASSRPAACGVPEVCLACELLR